MRENFARKSRAALEDQEWWINKLIKIEIPTSKVAARKLQRRWFQTALWN